MDYTELYELLRKEKYNESLQELPKKFMLSISEYLNEKKNTVTSETDPLMSSTDASKKELENSIAIFKELILKRKRKILNLVFVATETGIMKRDYENMLVFEKNVFEKLVKTFEEGDKELSKIIAGQETKKDDKLKMVIFQQDIEQFVGMSGETIGPFKKGDLANLAKEVADIFISEEKATLVDED